jgi:nucleoside-diphosphate-sugar epimerase
VRIFVAGASGVIGRALVPLLAAEGHELAGMTRSAHRAPELRDLGCEPVVCDVYDLQRLKAAILAFSPQAVVHQLTDLPDDVNRIGEFAERNDRIRTEGTANLLAAAHAAGVQRFLAQSIAWKLPAERAESMRAFEAQVLAAGGVVVRYGQIYGPGTYYPDPEHPPPPPRVSVAAAAVATVGLLDAASGVVGVIEP